MFNLILKKNFDIIFIEKEKDQEGENIYNKAKVKDDRGLGYHLIVIFMILTFWFIIGGTVLGNYWEFVDEIEDLPHKFLACVLFIIGGPLYIVVGIMIDILDMILPEGWDDDDGYF